MLVTSQFGIHVTNFLLSLTVTGEGTPKKGTQGKLTRKGRKPEATTPFKLRKRAECKVLAPLISGCQLWH